MRPWPLFFSLGLVACVADPHPSQDDDVDAVAPGADLAEVGDASPLDGRAPDAAPPPTGCVPEVSTWPTDGFELYEPQVGGEAVFVHRHGPDGAMRAVEIETDAPAGGPGDLLLDASGPARLLLRPDGAGGRRLIYRMDGQDTPLGDVPPGWPGLSGEAPPRRWVEPGGAVWVASDAIHHLHEGRAGPRWLGPAYGPSIADGWIAWVHTDPREVRASPPDDEARAIGPAERTAGVVATAGHVWWLSGGRPYVWVFGEAAGRPVGALEGCGALDADGGRALVVCGGGEPEMTLYLLGVDGAARQIHRAPSIMAPRAEAGGLAWSSWPDADAWCGGMSEGTVWWWPRGAAQATAVAPMTSGCLCCGRYWPPPQIDLGARVVAWNYAATMEGHVGVARCP